MPYYAVINGRSHGIYDNWAECTFQVQGYPNAVYEKFYTLYEAEQYYSKHFPLDASDSDESVDYGSRVIIYADGSTLNNGSNDASSGIGIYYGENDPRNSSISLAKYINDIPTTSQRAELMAIKIALNQILANWSLHVYTIRSDSLYAINCITKWQDTWETTGHTTTKNEPVQNRDLINDCLSLLEELENEVDFEHVKGHQGDKGNEEADRLAKRAARNAKELLKLFSQT